MQHHLDILGTVRSDYRDRFGIPRQPGLVAQAEASLIMHPPFDDARLFDGLEAFSHVWISFIFHATLAQGWRSRVRPPRLGGNERVGVFATRSPFRPNHLGLSVVRLLGIEVDAGVRLRLAGHDLLDGTPVVDIRPYLPYVDSVPEASGGFAPDSPPPRLIVEFSAQAEQQLAGHPRGMDLRALIEQMLALDPRPAYQRGDSGRTYGTRVADLEVRWRHSVDRVCVIRIAEAVQ